MCHRAVPALLLTPHSGHYDILYKAGDVPPPIHHQPVPQQNLQVNLANYTDDFVATSSNVADVMGLIPGMFPTTFGQQWPSLSYDFSPSPAPKPQVAPVQPYPSIPTPATPVSTAHLGFAVPMHTGHASQYNPARHHSIHLDQPPMTLPIHPPPPVSIERSNPVALERGGPFRPSMYELEPGFGSVLGAQPFQTSIFRK